MKIVVSGSTGLVGEPLCARLREHGHGVRRLVRRAAQAADEIAWNPAAGELDRASLEGAEAVVHLGGENIAARRWTPAQKEKIRASRVDSTALLSREIAALAAPPRVFVVASAIGVYGDRGESVLTEESEAGEGFLAEVCSAWESAAAPAAEAGVRVVHLRYGVILSPRGGALRKMLTPFKLGVGGVLGSGKQYMSWITLDDAVRATAHAVECGTLSGAVNCVAPNAVTNAEFTRAMAAVLHRPAVLPMPGFAARLAFGEMADELLLASTRVQPTKLAASGFAFLHAELQSALGYLLRSK